MRRNTVVEGTTEQHTYSTVTNSRDQTAEAGELIVTTKPNKILCVYVGRTCLVFVTAIDVESTWPTAVCRLEC